ncbi:ShlB/FhaC/HecB family hemolysin secretion/activation protein [Xenorhabdus sp. PB61.4]|uniref:ShlB/FhaC/HecB family hemolysin secretion/activation protein n=2 Tax=Xenorhabdus sp. PB61.4 TaxID=2788940 RepID=UPI001E39A8E8|nr:ShlB/FhaC/HecB family hemolysin secretion/activation protein [Xenorhabdus sp. PB61.4]MCC8367586.1 ShlB/FhaC/HecB family hemolysin secretion/activation protein [Xenorhabdus sp. PB61.4]
MVKVTPSNMLIGLAGWAIFVSQPVHADNQFSIHDQQQKKQQQYQQQQQQALEQRLEAKAPTVRLLDDTSSVSNLKFPKESPCFVIHQVMLSGQEDLPHWLPLQRLADQANGHCLGSQGINLLMGNIQDRLVSHGWVTSRVLAPQQDLRGGELKLVVLAGKIHQITRTSESNHYATLYTAIPAHEGNLFDLRDMEQGLENLQRLPTVQAKMELVPAAKPGESDIVIHRQQSRYWRVGSWVDDSGNKSTGRYQGGLMLALDNPTSLSDLFYVTASRDLGFAGKKNTKNYSVHYSVPFGYWQFGVTGSHYTYAQTVPLYGSGDTLYRGEGNSFITQLSRVLHRNATSKTTATYEVRLRQSKNFLGKAKIAPQERHTTDWKLGLNHRHYLGTAILDAGVSYQRGTRWFGAQPAFEEWRSGDDHSTALTKILQWSVDLEIPFSISDQSFRYQAKYLRQMSNTQLTSQDQFSIGNRWNIRGFDGERSLSADRGWYLRNTLAWKVPLPSQELYLGGDYGEVDGRGMDGHPLIGRHLAGGVVGMRGNLSIANISYDFSVGTPFSKPDGFKTGYTNVNFSVNWNY